MKLIFKYIRPFVNKMAFGMSLKVVGSVLELMLPFIMTHILEKVIVRGNLTEVLLWGVLMIACAAGACVSHIFGNRTAGLVSRNFSESLRRDLFAKTLRLSAAQTDKFTIPSLESRITTDTYNMHHFTGMMQRMGMRAPILLIGGIAMTLIMDAYLALVMIAIAPLIFILVFLISKNGVPLYTKVQQAVDGMVRVVREDSQGIRVIKALSKVDYEHRRFDKVNRNLVKKEKVAGIVMGSANPIMTLLMNMGIVAVVALSASRVSRGLSSPATVIAFMQYFTQISMALMTVSRIFVMYTKCAASSKRIAEVLDTEEDILVYSEEEYPSIKTDDYIVFDNVSFSYKGKRNNLSNISFTLPKGSSLGIIGATGSGKSTLIKLLLRFYDVSEGNIYINGRNIRTIPKDELYAMFGTAMQHDFLYNETIEENIQFGRDLTHDEIVAAAKTAQADEFISAFEDGYKHVLAQKGANISGGQKQRILISRAIAAKPDILILDDSSSALDYKTDAMLRAALKENMSGTTVITVAQRVSSIKDSELIIVLDHGEIIGIGKHSELLDSCIEYKEISDSQMGGAFVE